MHLSRLITMGELTACFAHEVTNPLTLIRGHLRFIDETLSKDHPLRVNFEVIDRASRRIEEMTHRTLDFSKKKTRLAGRYQIGDLISEALCFLQPYLRLNHIDLHVVMEPELPDILADRAQMVQAIVNLVQNAADAMIDLERRILTVTATADNKSLRVVISDTGKGIAPVNLPKIFKPFFTTKSSRGTGLGLYITKQVIEEQRGSIAVETGDRGTSFVISLPL
jgi:two-component system NtrC family sensor kinase